MPETDTEQSRGPEGTEPESHESLGDAFGDLLDLSEKWVRQVVEKTMQDKVVLPLQRLGFTLFSSWAAATLLVFGLLSVSIGLFMLLGEAITYPVAFLAVGGTYLLGSLVFFVLQRKMMQK